MGLPRVITTDQGREFNNKLNRELMKQLNIEHRLTTPYRPQVIIYHLYRPQFLSAFNFTCKQANGLDERFNQTLQNMLIKHISKNKSEWDMFLDACVFAYNTSVHESTKFSPFELMFGRKPVLPVDINMGRSDSAAVLEAFNTYQEFTPSTIEKAVEQKNTILQEAKANIVAAQQQQKETYDRKYRKEGKIRVICTFHSVPNNAYRCLCDWRKSSNERSFAEEKEGG